MDTKLQSTRSEPVVRLHELAKIRADAERAGSLLGCLTIRNKHGVGVVVIDEADFAKLISKDRYDNANNGLRSSPRSSEGMS